MRVGHFPISLEEIVPSLLPKIIFAVAAGDTVLPGRTEGKLMMGI